nr:right-handed parallel beta-helix repeat-containing protein [Haematobacter missouriensis]
MLYSVSNFAITGNTFEKASNDLIQISRASHNGLIENNFLNDVVVTNSKAHPDLIQIFGYDGMNPHDITIRGNYLYDDPATGLNLAQGIFLSNPTGEGFRNILIEENLVSVRSPNSIFVSGGEENVIIRHNSLIAGPEGLKGGVIRLKDSTGQGFDNAGITVEDNIASRISDETGNSHVGDNFVYGSAANSPFQGNGSHWRDFLLRDPDVAPGMGAGERLQELADGENPPAAAIMAVESDADSLPLFGHEIFLGEEEGYSSLAAAPAATDSHPAATSLLLTSEEIASLPPEADFHI